jgi:hypothetical protein
MTSAILLAGYNNKRDVRHYAKTVSRYYNELFVETGYKPLRAFEILREGKIVSKPLIVFTLERLFESDEIDDVTIVGHQGLLERHLRGLIDLHEKPCRIIDQSARIPPEAVDRFRIVPRKVRAGSIAGNIIKGYAASKACESRRHALFAVSDSPFTRRAFIEYFLRVARRYEAEYAIVVPAVVIEGELDRFGRHPLKLVDDAGVVSSGETDSHGRRGFRASSLVYGNPHGFDINMANSAYSLRKGLSPSVQLRLFRITRSLGYPNIYSKYFITKDLSITEAENIVSAFFSGKLKILPVRDVESSYDYDGTNRDLQEVSEMLRTDRS